jgi:pyruvate formate lyase activating enzyme
MDGAVFDIQRFSVHDGPGVRTTVFFKGCPLRCYWCHNPESWSPKPELMFDSAKCVSCGRCIKACKHGATTAKGFDRKKCVSCGTCAEVCPSEARRLAGKKISLSALMKEIKKDLDFFKNSGGGVTASGGEPLSQAKFVEAFFKACRKAGIHTTLQTSGFGKKEDLKKILKNTDLVMLDIKHPDPKKHKEGTGADNTLILENAQIISNSKVPLIIRTPVIPGFNSSPATLKKISAIARVLKATGKVEHLKFHNLGVRKHLLQENEK